MVAEALAVHFCGLVPYRQALGWMRCLQQARRADAIGDCLLLLQHPAVVTLGMSGGREDVLLPPERMEVQGIEVIETERGGRATLHAPGQLVAYPVMKLDNGDLHSYLWKLEEAAQQVLSTWKIPAGRDEAHPGMWVQQRKIAAIGLAVRDGVAYHGLALNVCNDMSLYQLIQPCGLPASRVTSMQEELSEPVDLEVVQEEFAAAFCRVFARQAERSQVADTFVLEFADGG